MYNKPMNIKRQMLNFIVFIIVLAGVWGITFHDAFLYQRNIGRITQVTDTYVKSKTGTDGVRDYEEKYYHQEITAGLTNGSNKGQLVHFTNDYGSSEVYQIRLSRGDQVFLEGLTEENGRFTATLSGIKRDHWVLTLLAALFCLFLLVGGRHGILTIGSLILNMAAFWLVLRAYLHGTNILGTTIPMTIFFTAMLLFFMYGKNRKTWLTFLATILTVLITTAIAFLVMQTGTVDYDFMDYLIQPYDPEDAELIFLSEVLVGCLGAVMDVVITIVMTVDQIHETGGDTSRKSLIASCREVGDDLVGTMINLMFFTNIAACMPAFILYLRNGIAFRTILRYNVFFELARFLTGSIGIVLAIPIAAAVAIHYYGRKEVQS